MRAHGKAHPTKGTKKMASKSYFVHNGKKMNVPAERVSHIVKIIRGADEALPWRSVMKDIIGDNECGIILKASRLESELTQSELASKIKDTQPNIAAMESGKRAISKVMAKKLSAVLNVDYRVFL